MIPTTTMVLLTLFLTGFAFVLGLLIGAAWRAPCIDDPDEDEHADDLTYGPYNPRRTR